MALPLPSADSWDISGAMLSIPWVMTSLAIFTVGARVFLRRKFSAPIESDDWIMMVAVALQIAYQAIVTMAVIKGAGKTLDMTRPPEEFIDMLKWSWFTSPMAVLVAVVSRLSIGVLLTRIFGIRTWFKWFMYIFTGCVLIIGLLNFIIVWVQARPIEALWNIFMSVERWDPEVQQMFSIVLHAFLAASDLLYVLFPVVFIWKLNMPVRQKIGLTILMGFSVITFGIALAKLVMIIDTMQSTGEIGEDTADLFYIFAVLTLITGIEANLVIIIGCVPKLRSVAKLSAWGSIGSAFSSLLRGSGEKRGTSSGRISSGASKNQQHYDRSGYSDLEMQPHRLRGDGASGMMASAVHNSSQKHLVPVYDYDIHQTSEFVLTTTTDEETVAKRRS